jgi:hypothetical protein
MDEFKSNKGIGPGGAKCPCCVPADKRRLRQIARSRLKQEDRRIEAGRES